MTQEHWHGCAAAHGDGPCTCIPVPPFPQEPAFNSPESIALAAGTIQGFTPGLYEVRYVEAKTRLEECVATIHAEDGTELASVWGRGDGEEGRAVIPEAADNARLFGAAPGLLAERDRLRAEVESLRALHLEAETELGEYRDDAIDAREQRDALADALESALRLLTFNCGVPENQPDVVAGMAALRKAGR